MKTPEPNQEQTAIGRSREPRYGDLNSNQIRFELQGSSLSKAEQAIQYMAYRKEAEAQVLKILRGSCISSSSHHRRTPQNGFLGCRLKMLLERLFLGRLCQSQ
ncbi:MAG: hypothetical protein NT004_10095 [Bacteroidetes bacterium]|nr:hypothetical protein [Bacteroidota bacterium]